MSTSGFPQTFGRYTLLDRLAVGGMAELFIAKRTDEGEDAPVIVIKRILSSYCYDADFVRMFIDEASITSKLDHPNIVEVFDFDVVEGRYFIAMEFIHGRDLLDILKDGETYGRRPTVAECVWIVMKVAGALQYAHLRDHQGRPLNIIHRDVTPHNIMLSFDAVVKLMDFGIAKAAERSTKTQAGTVKGKVAYMSPEQARGLELDGRSDLFALATVLWEALTYERLFLRQSDFETLTAVLTHPAPPPSQYRDGIDPELDAIILKALSKNRDERYPDLASFAEALRQWYDAHAVTPAPETLKDFMQAIYIDKVLPPVAPGQTPVLKDPVSNQTAVMPGYQPPAPAASDPKADALLEADPSTVATVQHARSPLPPRPQTFQQADTILHDPELTQDALAQALETYRRERTSTQETPKIEAPETPTKGSQTLLKLGAVILIAALTGAALALSL